MLPKSKYGHRAGSRGSECAGWASRDRSNVHLALLVVGGLLWAKAVAWSAPFLPVTEFHLTNGLQVLTLEDPSSPLVAVQIWYHVGSADEPPGRHGFAHLFEHMMFRGTDRLGPTEHFDLIHRVGGSCNATTDFDATHYYETLPAQQLELALWLESERMAFLTVDGAGFSTERKVVEEERRLDLSAPYGDIADLGPPAIFGDHPYGHDPLGTFQDLRQATPTQVHAWWVQRYTPNNATLVIVGDIERRHVRALCERYFGWIPPVPQAPRDIPELKPWAKPRAITLNLANAPAPGVGILWRTVPEGDPDSLALDLLATILGGGDSSRLYRRLVADNHDAVQAMAMQYGLSRGGVFGAGAVLPPLIGNTDHVLDVLRAELARLRTDGVTEEELEKARNGAMRGLVDEAQTVGGKANLIGDAAVVGSGVGELNSRLDRLRSLTREDLLRVAQRYLDPQHAMTVVVPASSLWGELGRLLFGKAKVEEAAPAAFAPDTLLRGRPGVVRPADLPLHPPIAEANPPVPNPEVRQELLTNGLRVVMVRDPNTRLMDAILALPFGSWAEQKPGAAAMTVRLLTQGTEAHDDRALAEELALHAIHLSASAGHDSSQVQMSCLADQAERGLALMAEVLERPTFPDAPFKVAVAQTLTGLKVADNDPMQVAGREFAQALFPGHPYGRRVEGDPADVTALNTADLKAFWARAARPQKATLVVVGPLDEGRVMALVRRSFGMWQAGTATADAPSSEAGPSHQAERTLLSAAPAPPPPPGPTRILLINWPGANQSEIVIGSLGITSHDPDKPIANLVSSYFGGSFGSRLMKAIRVKKGATYGVSGGFETERFAGSFVVRTFTKTGSTAETLRTALAELEGLLERPPTPDELAFHKRAFLGGAASRLQTPAQLADLLAYLAATGLPLDQFQRNLARIGSATAADCESLARRVIAPDHLLIVVVGDAPAIEADLVKIAPVTLVDREGHPARVEPVHAGPSASKR